MDVRIILKVIESENRSLNLLSTQNSDYVEIEIDPCDGHKALTAIVKIDEIKLALRKLSTR